VSTLALAGSLGAQQREPAVEVFGLAGAYLHGNLSVATEWKPQFGGGVLLPLGRKWAALADVTTSVVDANFRHSLAPPSAPADNYVRERRVILTPSVARMWRREAFSIYAGAGFGFEHERHYSRVRPITGYLPDGQPVVDPSFQESRTTRTDAMLVLRTGVIVNLNRRLVLRGDLAVLPRYADERASKSALVGVGWRF
jgi:hypothetical protein